MRTADLVLLRCQRNELMLAAVAGPTWVAFVTIVKLLWLGYRAPRALTTVSVGVGCRLAIYRELLDVGNVQAKEEVLTFALDPTFLWDVHHLMVAAHADHALAPSTLGIRWYQHDGAALGLLDAFNVELCGSDLLEVVADCVQHVVHIVRVDAAGVLRNGLAWLGSSRRRWARTPSWWRW